MAERGGWVGGVKRGVLNVYDLILSDGLKSITVNRVKIVIARWWECVKVFVKKGSKTMNADNFARIYGQILDSSIASDYEARHFFMDLLLLANWKNGQVDMTDEAIARRLNMPLEKVVEGLRKLNQPDALSRSKREGGRRIVPVDVVRPWGWVIVNYDIYRQIRSVESNRDYMRGYMREYRKEGPKRKRVVRAGSPGPLPGEVPYVNGVEAGTIDAETHEPIAVGDTGGSV